MLKEKVSYRQIQRILKAYLRERPVIEDIAFCRGGFFNTTVRVKLRGHGRRIIQVSPSEEQGHFWHERSFLQREVHFLKHLRRSLFPVAGVLHQDFSKKIIDRDYLVLEEIEGHNWYYFAKKLSSLQNRSLYRQLGEYAKKIHAVSRGDQGWFGFPAPYSPFRKWSGFVLKYLGSLDLHNEQYGLIDMGKEVTPYMAARSLIDKLDQIKAPRLVHGDLWPRNILIDKKEGEHYQITGILDWERGCWGDPRFEWVLQCMNYGKSFWDAYGTGTRISGDLLIRGKLYRAGFIYQAALEEVHYFKNKAKAYHLIQQMQNVIRSIKKA